VERVDSRVHLSALRGDLTFLLEELREFDLHRVELGAWIAGGHVSRSIGVSGLPH